MKYIQLFENWLASKSQPFLFEGGAAGHMMHPFDDKELTFGDFKNMIDYGLQGRLDFEEEPTEKTDGQNVFATIQDGKVKFARNKGDLKRPMSLGQFTQKFANHPSEQVRDTFTFAANDLASMLTRLPKDVQDKVVNNGKDFMNMELIYSLNPNVINYDKDVIEFHGIKKTDGNGNIIGEDTKAATEIAQILKRLEANVGKTFSVIPPTRIKLMKDVNYAANKADLVNRVESLRKKYNLKDTDPVSKYHGQWWMDLINKDFPDLDDDVKLGLMQRWAYGDKKSLDMRSLKSRVSPVDFEAIKNLDKTDLRRKQKENIGPFEDIFLNLGARIISNAQDFLTANPTEEAKRLRSSIDAAAKNLRKGGSEQQIARLEDELSRLEKLGGLEMVYPTEGIVFKYKGKTYKLNGSFAAINQLLGILRYGR